MIYEFPPRSFLFPGTSSWLIAAISYVLLNVGIAVGIIRFHFRCYQGKPCKRSTPWIWAGIGVLYIVLAIFVHSEPDVSSFGSQPRSVLVSEAPWICILILTVFGKSIFVLDAGNSIAALRAGCLFRVCIFCVLIFLFLSLVVPAVGRGRYTYRMHCRYRLDNIGRIVLSLTKTREQLINSQVQEGNHPARSWRLEVQFADDSSAAVFYDKAQSWNSPQNLRIKESGFRPFGCTATPVAQRNDDLGVPFTAYVALTGEDTAFPDGKGLPPEKFTDGLSNTILFAEAVGQQIPWMAPRDVEVTQDNIGINLPGQHPHQSPAILSSYHYPAGANVLMVDGSVKFLKKATDSQVLKAMITPAGGETVTGF
ncbi:MAG: hypothetical protein JWM11_1608 [Planctomycetaceae bacterium]|nr:hypothetical protein [Planctomycetaceae bacterium]